MPYKDENKRKEVQREAAKRYRESKKGLTVDEGLTQGLTVRSAADKDLEKCRYCGTDLPRLQRPRKHPGACLNCTNDIPVSRPATYTRQFTGQMTAFEREHYKSELRPGEYNPVSKPGDSHYSERNQCLAIAAKL